MAASVRRRVVCGLSCAAIVAGLSACSGGSGSPGPLAVRVQQRGQADCSPAPNPSTATVSWNTPIWFAIDSFANTSGGPLTIKSVSLIDAHNVVLRGAVAYDEGDHSQRELMQTGATADIARSVPPPDWARHQAVPGAVIPPGHDLWQIFPEVAQVHRGGGWAIGEIVRYSAGGQTYSVKVYTGYGIGVPLTVDKTGCSKLLNAILAAWGALTN